MISLLFLPEHVPVWGGADYASIDRAPASCSCAIRPGPVAGFVAKRLSYGSLVLTILFESGQRG